MAKKIDKKRQEELSELRDWCLTIFKYKTRRHPPEFANLYAIGERGINDAFQRGDLRALRAGARDLIEDAMEFQPEDFQELDALLRQRFGRGLTEESGKVQKEIKRILKRGKITSADEFRLLEAHVSEISGEDSKKAEIEAINRLLIAFRPEAGGDD